MSNKKIALLIDVDNVKISGEAFKELYAELKERGDVVFCKFYGYNDRKHIYLSEFVVNYGYETAPFMRFKKRTSQLDNRILVDAVKLNYQKPEIDTYCVVAGDGDLIPLFVELKSSGKTIIDVNTDYQHINGHLADIHIMLKSIDKKAEVYTSKITKIAEKVKEQPKKAKAAATKAKEEVKYEIDGNLARVLRSITARYTKLDFTSNTDKAEKIALVEEIERVIKLENGKGQGIHSNNLDVRQIFVDLQEVAEDIRESLN